MVLSVTLPSRKCFIVPPESPQRGAKMAVDTVRQAKGENREPMTSEIVV